MAESADTANAAAEAAARRSYGRLVAYLAAETRNVAAAEDALADAFAAALTQWPRDGVPDRPEAWLLSVARRKSLDGLRRRHTAEAATGHLRLLGEERESEAMSDDIPDRRLALMFACAHPAIDEGVRAPLILQTILGFDAAAIASAFLVSPAAMSQRLVRAKARIGETGIPFRVPEGPELGERLDAVLQAIYAAFAEGWTDAAGAEMRRRNLADEAIWLGRLVAALMPEEPEALGLLALMLFAESRRAARRNGQGGYVPLAEQDCALWDIDLIDEAEDSLRRAAGKSRPGRYQLEAAVQSAHAARRFGGAVDWPAIAALYRGLWLLTGSPVVAVNEAVAIARAGNIAAGLARLDAIDDARLTTYQPYLAARADLLARAGRVAEATDAYDRAIGLESDPAVRAFLQDRRGRLSDLSSARGGALH